MSNAFIRFWHILLAAEKQLRWGTDPQAVRHSASALQEIAPTSLLVGPLEAKAARLQALAATLSRPVRSSGVERAR